MRARTFVTLLAVPVAVVAMGGSGLASPGGEKVTTGRDEPLVEAIRDVDRSTSWQLVDRIPLDFETYHPQGLAVVGNRLFLSSVEVIEPPVQYPEPDEDGDRWRDEDPDEALQRVTRATPRQRRAPEANAPTDRSAQSLSADRSSASADAG